MNVKCPVLQNVHVLVDNWDIRKVNSINLEMATSASLLLLPQEFTEYDLYAQICSLSYMGDWRMLFAEDKDKRVISSRLPRSRLLTSTRKVALRKASVTKAP
ncbi:uncharacterized protein [Miscanthus floridulus]|uniref:uncharacterized protein isoform X1 n=1 Tax=Miscanthus floridulus TaxID=154761 RepID=UPI003457671A